MALPQESGSVRVRVGTTCGSGWIDDQQQRSIRVVGPPATAGGTDPVQAEIVSLEAKQVGKEFENVRCDLEAFRGA